MKVQNTLLFQLFHNTCLVIIMWSDVDLLKDHTSHMIPTAGFMAAAGWGCPVSSLHPAAALTHAFIKGLPQLLNSWTLTAVTLTFGCSHSRAFTGCVHWDSQDFAPWVRQMHVHTCTAHHTYLIFLHLRYQHKGGKIVERGKRENAAYVIQKQSTSMVEVVHWPSSAGKSRSTDSTSLLQSSKKVQVLKCIQSIKEKSFPLKDISSSLFCAKLTEAHVMLI